MTTSRCVAVALLVAAGVLIGGIAPPPAAGLTTEACLAKKLKERGKLRKCQATENGKALQGKPADLAKCQTKFNDKLAAINAQATAAGIPCRYGVNPPVTAGTVGTVTDYDTGLEWERKVDENTCPGTALYHECEIHSYTVTETWNDTLTLNETLPTGSAFWYFLGLLNGAGGEGCFANHCDWRLPSKDELASILLEPYPCGTVDPPDPCIDQAVFGPTVGEYHWSASTDAGDARMAVIVDFSNGSVFDGFKFGSSLYVRAVRSAL